MRLSCDGAVMTPPNGNPSALDAISTVPRLGPESDQIRPFLAALVRKTKPKLVQAGFHFRRREGFLCGRLASFAARARRTGPAAAVSLYWPQCAQRNTKFWNCAKGRPMISGVRHPPQT
jgi:hypothetical protein